MSTRSISPWMLSLPRQLLFFSSLTRLCGRLSVLEAKNSRLRLQLSQQQIAAPMDEQPPAPARLSQNQQAPGMARSSGSTMASARSKVPPSLRPEDLAAGRCVVVITANNLVLERGFSGAPPRPLPEAISPRF